MAQVFVRNIEDAVKAGLKARAIQHGWSMEEEVRQILRRAVSEEEEARPRLAASRLAARFASASLTEPLPELHGQTIEPMGMGA